MKVAIEPGSYVVAVSGGVDSVALLDMLHGLPDVHLTVAHYDHGIRMDSQADRHLVQRHAESRRLPFVFEEGHLGAGASEDVARKARYEFLRKVQAATGAQALVTAHHQDDMLETAIINMLRGTGRKGLGSLRDRSDVRRPLLHLSKADVRAYAAEQGLVWREDSTNQDTTILRNYVRHILLPKLGPTGRKDLLDHIRHLHVLNQAIDDSLLTLLHIQPSRQTLDREWFISLPHIVAREILATWLRSHGIRSFDSKNLERLVVAAKTLPAGKRADVNAEFYLALGTGILALLPRDR